MKSARGGRFDAGFNSQVQRGVGFDLLFDLHANETGDNVHGAAFAALARTLLRNLHPA